MRQACGFAIAAVLALIAATRLGAADAPAFDTWTVRDGLPQGSVYDVLQTRDGYLWLATLGGLVRFDGVRLTVFERATAPGIASNRFATLFEDRAGTLWAGTEDGGLTRYAGGQFRSYSRNEGLPANRVRAIDQDEGGAILALTDGGLARMRGERFEPVSLAALMPLNPRAIPGTTYHSGISLRDAGGLHTFFGGTHRHFPVDAIGVIVSRFRDRSGALWCRRDDGSILRIRGATAEPYVPPHPLPSFKSRVMAMHEDRAGNLWLSVEGEGLLRVSRDGVTRYTTEQGLAGNTVSVIFEDREGNLWFGSLLNGLSRFRRRVVTMISTRDGLPVDNIYPLVERRNGSVVAGTWGKGIVTIAGGRVDPGSRKLGSEWISSLTEDRAGALWVGTSGAGLFRIEGERITRLGLENAFVFALHEDRSGTMWAGTGDGVHAITQSGTRHYEVRDGLPHPHVQSILEEPDGTLWFATLGGVVRFDGKAFRTFGEREGLSSNHVRALFRDDAGVIWAGTYDGGLNRIANGKVTPIQKKDGLFDNGVFAILDDRRGNFWMTSNRGIFRTRRRDLDDFVAGRIKAVHSVGYGTEDGMTSPECNGGTQPAALRTTDGRLWFPTQGGIAVVDPAHVPISVVPPPVAIETVTTPDASYAAAALVELPRGTGRFRVDYTALSLTKPEQVRFRFRLEGIESDWVEAGTARSAVYSRVPPGRYTFRVRAANSDGVWNDRGASIALEILPPFWETRWFLAIAAAFVALSLLAFHRWRVRGIERAREMEASFLRRLMLSEEAERTRIASELHDSLGQSLMVIANRAIMASRDAQRGRPFEDHLTQISETSMQAADEVREIAHNLHPQHLERLGLTRALETMIDRARASTPVAIAQQIDPVDRLFRPELELSFYRLVQEALTNVLRHAEATHANVEIRRLNGHVVLAVQDDGRGFDLPLPGSEGLGLESIRQRTAMLGGTLRIESRRGSGTLIRAEIPLPEQRTDA